MKTIESSPLWIAGLVLLAESNVFACSCGEPSASVAFPVAKEVFAGTVIDISQTVRSAWTDGPLILLNEVRFQVKETWKGANTITKTVLTGLGGGDCGYPFVQGTDYLVYAYAASGYDGFVDICSPTMIFSAASENHLQFLGEGQKPIQPVLNMFREQLSTILTWQTNWVNFRLEAAESLQPPLVWKPLSNYVGVLGGYYVVTNETTSPRSFFRLAR